MFKVSIVTVTYNSSDKIRKFLDSLMLNILNIHEVFIIDNDSSDQVKTEEICKKYESKINITFIRNKNVGFGKSCNLGAALSSSNYILFLNPDTELIKHSLKILLDHKETSSADIIGGKAFNYEGKLHGTAVRLPNLFIGLFEFSNLGKVLNINSQHKKFYYEDKNILTSKTDQPVDVVSGGYLLITKKVFNQLGGFDESIFMYLEDVDLGKRAKDLGIKTVFCPHSIIWHVGGASSRNKYKIKHQAWFDSRKYYFKKHFGFLSNIIIQSVFLMEEFLLKKLKKI